MSDDKHYSTFKLKKVMNENEKTRSGLHDLNSGAADVGRSMEIIKQSIEQSRRDVERYTGRVMLLWGGLVFVTALVVGHLWQHTGNASWNLLWIFMAVVGIATASIMSRTHGLTPRGERLCHRQPTHTGWRGRCRCGVHVLCAHLCRALRDGGHGPCRVVRAGHSRLLHLHAPSPQGLNHMPSRRLWD